MEQRPSPAVPRSGHTNNTSGDESDMGEPRRRMLSRGTYIMKKAWGTSDVGHFFVSGPTDVATKPSHFFPYLSQGRLCTDSWSPQTFATLSWRQEFYTLPMFKVGDARLWRIGPWRECHESGSFRAKAVENIEGSFGRERQGVPFFWGLHCRRKWCSGPQTWDYD